MSSPKAKKRSKEFDYGTVSDNLAPQMRETAERIQHYKRKQLIDAIDIGRDLLGIQRKLDYGRFLEWIAVECQWSTRTAERYQRLAEVFGPRIDRLSNLGLERAHLLAQPSTPEVVVTQMLERTNAGDRPSTPEIRKLIKTEQKRLQEKNKQKEKGIESDETADAPAEIDEPVTAASPAAGRGEGSNAISPPLDNTVQDGPTHAGSANQDSSLGKRISAAPPEEAGVEPSVTRELADEAAVPAGNPTLAGGMGDDSTTGEPICAGGTMDGAAEGTSATREPSSNRLKPTRGSNCGDTDDDLSTGDALGTAPVWDGTAGKAAAPELRGNITDAGGVDDLGSTELKSRGNVDPAFDKRSSKVTKRKVEQPGLFDQSHLPDPSGLGGEATGGHSAGADQPADEQLTPLAGEYHGPGSTHLERFFRAARAQLHFGDPPPSDTDLLKLAVLWHSLLVSSNHNKWDDAIEAAVTVIGRLIINDVPVAEETSTG